MSEQYPGGFITKSPVAVTSSAASGVWTMSQYMQYAKAGPWPGLFPDPYFTNVAALLHMDGTNGGTSFPDNSLIGKYWSAAGAAVTDTSTTKFGTASASFPSSGSYITTLNSSSFNIATSDFTVEYWINTTTSSSQYICGQANSAGAASTVSVQHRIVSGNLIAYAYVGGSGYSITSSGVVNTGAWVHVAHVFSSGSMYLYINGVSQGFVSIGSVNVSANNWSVGRLGEYASATFIGYIDDFRITSGIARYTGNFTVPTAAYPNTGPATPVDPFFSNVKSLVHFDGTSGSTTFTDQIGNTWSVAASGPQLSTTQIKWGTAALNPNGSYITSTTTNYNVASSTDCTYECWMYTGSTARQRIFNTAWGAGSGAIICRIEPGGTTLSIYTPGASNITTGACVNTGAWYHIALVRYSNVWTIYVNGVSQGTATDSTAVTTNDIWLGGGSGGEILSGYIDDFRFTNGTARYTANFTPPQLPFPNTATATTTYATWNPSDKGTNVVISYNNLCGTTSSATGTVRATTSKSSGKWYWEETVQTVGTQEIGIANSSATLSNYLGQDANGWGYQNSGNKVNNASSASYGASYTSADVIGVALDLDNGTVGFYKNNTFQGNAYTGLSGSLFPALGASSATIDTQANFGQNPLKYTPPNGTFWNAADKNAAVTLSNNNMNYSTTATVNTQRANTSKSSGQWYFEYTALNSSGYVGISNSTDANSVTYGSTANSKVYSYLGGVYVSGSYAAYGASWTTNDVIGIAVDLTAGTLTFYKNGVSQGVATTGLTGSWYPSTGARGDTPNGQLNTGVSAFKYTPPSGYSAWDSTTYNPGVY